MSWPDSMITDVAVGIVFNNQGKVLITQRGASSTHPLYWEFPGGKIEKGEDAASALVRELKEEINIHCTELTPWMIHNAKLGSLDVRLNVFLVTGYRGEVKCLENQEDMSWVELSELPGFTFPESNMAIVNQLSVLTVMELLSGFGIGGFF